MLAHLIPCDLEVGVLGSVVFAVQYHREILSYLSARLGLVS
jgi:hypothetical protein